MSGLFSSGLLLKGATALLVAAPLLFNVTGGFGGGGGSDDEAVRTVVAEPMAAEAEPEPTVVSPVVPPAEVPRGRASARLARVADHGSPLVTTAPRRPAPDTEESTSVNPPVGGVRADDDESLPPDPVIEDVGRSDRRRGGRAGCRWGG